MNRMTFIGRTTREAMQAAKARFGPEIEIVGSRQVPQGVELTAQVAAIPAAVGRRGASASPGGSRLSPSPGAQRGEDQRGARTAAFRQATVARPMSTVSFEEFVRTRQESSRVSAVAAATVEAPDVIRAPSAAQTSAPQFAQRLAEPEATVRAAAARPVPRTTETAIEGQALMQELQSIKRFIAGQLETVRWFDTTRRRPAQLRLLRRLLARGFSPALSRSLCDLLPVDFDDKQSDRWLAQTLTQTLRGFSAPAPAAATSIFDAGGVFALTGPTGVGKTTSIAKIAARYALSNGAAGVALITADVYRIGAQDQLRSFGRLLGVPVHVAHDRAALADLLGLFGDRRLVLIDTAGVSQRDERVSQLLAALDLEPIQRVVVMNAAMQAAGLQEVVGGYRAQDARGILLSKVDEAVQLGPVVDTLLRNRLNLTGVCDGQRVPEDFQLPDVGALVAMALGELPEDEDAELAASELRLILEGGHV